MLRLSARWRIVAPAGGSMSAAPAFTTSHLGLCVSDLGRSLRFWCDGLGFEKAEAYSIGDEYGPAMEVDGRVVLASQFVRKGGLAIELLCFASPGAEGRPSARRNQRGLTHLSFAVDDVDACARWLVAHGGTLVEGTRTAATGADGVQVVFVADPDGTRVELIRAAVA
jgi:catechol 2,3-dioxygenase-like lactoylglutathione lyase family enzyme